MKVRQWVLGVSLSLCSVASAWAHDYKVGPLDIQDVWVRASAPGQLNGAGYMLIENDAATGDRLLSVSSDVADRVELHTIETENGVARMRHVPDGLEIPADGELSLAPGGYHIMFMGLKQPFSENSEVAATLKFEKAGDVPVNFHVKKAGHRASGDHGSHGMKH